MGLFDGAPDGTGSTADLAIELNIPVVLVVDVKGQAASAAAVIEGFVRHRDDIQVAAVIFNRVGGTGHRRSLEAACGYLKIPLLGFVPRDDQLTLPERHLGLVQAHEHHNLEVRLEAAADIIEAHVDTDRLREIAVSAMLGGIDPVSSPLPPLGQRIAVARDEAFAFAYPGVIEGWRTAGSDVQFFSPLADEAPGDTCDAVYLPGGYPELHAGSLSTGRRFLPGLRNAAARGAHIFGECGGYMVLGQQLTDANGDAHEMAGLLPLETSFAARQLHLGYRRVKTLNGTSFGPAGSMMRGHEFHYTKVIREDHSACAAFFDTWDARGEARGKTGLQDGNVAGSFIHLVDREN